MQIQINLCGGDAHSLAKIAQSEANQKGLALLGAIQPPYAAFAFRYCASLVCGVCCAKDYLFAAPLVV